MTRHLALLIVLGVGGTAHAHRNAFEKSRNLGDYQARLAKAAARADGLASSSPTMSRLVRAKTMRAAVQLAATMTPAQFSALKGTSSTGVKIVQLKRDRDPSGAEYVRAVAEGSMQEMLARQGAILSRIAGYDYDWYAHPEVSVKPLPDGRARLIASYSTVSKLGLLNRVQGDISTVLAGRQVSAPTHAWGGERSEPRHMPRMAQPPQGAAGGDWGHVTLSDI